MTYESTFPQRLTKVDELSLGDHTYLSEDDECYFLGEYTAREGFTYSPTNDLILNLKKSMDRRGHPEWPYKVRAIQQSAAALRNALEPMGQSSLRNVTFVPIPPSKAKSDPLYDDRLVQVLHHISPQSTLDVREIIIQKHSTEPVHSSEVRPRPEDIASNYELDAAATQPEPSVIVIFDDMLTTGAHFLAAKRVLSARFPSVKIIGLFIARRIPNTSDLDEVEF